MLPRTPRLLIVEDNKDAIAILKIVLEKKGFDTILAPNARSGVEVGTINDFDLLLCDIGLPDGNGMDVLRELRQQKDFPAIAFTALTMPSDIISQMEAGFDLHIAKPFHFSDLLDAINKLLELQPTHM